MNKKHRPGQVVPENGVYQAVHDSHRLMHQVTLPEGSRFPECRRCGGAVRFEWLRACAATHIGAGHYAILQEYRREPTQAKKQSA
jgi:hypothetical protein